MPVINVAIIGAGVRSIAFCDFIAKNPELIRLSAIADVNIAKAQLLNNIYNLNAVITSDQDSAIKSADAVIISTPDYAHVAPAVAALRAGKHVYLEKPLATTLEDCDMIAAAAKNSPSVCYLGFNMRHSPVHEKLHQLIQDGQLGKITTIEANEWYYGGRTYFRRWNRLRKFGGGLWLTKACHDFDLITWIAGATPCSIYAKSSLSHYKPIADAGPRCRDCKLKFTCPDYYDIHKPMANPFEETWRKLQLQMDQPGNLAPDICLFNSDKDTFDNGIAVIEYTNDIRVTYTVNVLAARTTRQMRLIGTEAMAEADMETGLIQITKRHSFEKTTLDLNADIKGSHGGADQKILSDFFKLCKNGGTPRSTLKDGRLAVQMALAATQSDDNHSVVMLQTD